MVHVFKTVRYKLYRYKKKKKNRYAMFVSMGFLKNSRFSRFFIQDTLADGEVVSGEVLELRVLERLMRECYVDEQRCEEELKIMRQLLAKEKPQTTKEHPDFVSVGSKT